MIRGVSFTEINAEIFFLQLNKLMDVPVHEWYVDEVDCNCFNFQSGKYSGLEFNNALCALSRLSFVRIRRYPTGTPINEINTYEDFTKSDCDVLILFYDGGFFEIYEKEDELISRTFQFCTDSGFGNVEYIYDTTDQRYWMYF